MRYGDILLTKVNGVPHAPATPHYGWEPVRGHPAPGGPGVSFDVIARFYRLMSRFRSRKTYGFGSARPDRTLPPDGRGFGMPWMGLEARFEMSWSR